MKIMSSKQPNDQKIYCDEPADDTPEIQINTSSPINILRNAGSFSRQSFDSDTEEDDDLFSMM